MIKNFEGFLLENIDVYKYRINFDKNNSKIFEKRIKEYLKSDNYDKTEYSNLHEEYSFTEEDFKKIEHIIEDMDTNVEKINESNTISPNLMKDFEKIAENERKKGAEYEDNPTIETLSIKLSDGKEYFFQDEEYNELMAEVPDNMATEDYILAVAVGWE